MGKRMVFVTLLVLVLTLSVWASAAGLSDSSDAASVNAVVLASSTALVETVPATLEPVIPAATEIPATSVPTITPIPTLGVGSTMIGNDGMVLLYVPSGEFLMGASYDDVMGAVDERYQHPVTLDAFWIDQTEITNAMYAKCVSAGVCSEPKVKNSYSREYYYDGPEFANYPVINVDWNMANTYCGWAGRSLPSEAQWEKAARGVDGSLYPWGNDPADSSLLNYKENVGDTTEVGKYPGGQSTYGAYDMAGNVWEWVNDWHDQTYYKNSPTLNPLGPDAGQTRVLRGGSWLNSGYDVRASNRNDQAPTDFYNVLGFRCSFSQ